MPKNETKEKTKRQETPVNNFARIVLFITVALIAVILLYCHEIERRQRIERFIMGNGLQSLQKRDDDKVIELILKKHPGRRTNI